MPTNSLTIPKEPPQQTSLNFQELRRQGIKHLEKLGTGIWTDFNLHDPGITILEVLCFALTDLGYRTNFPITDLLAPKEESNSEKHFFTAPEILPVCPVTENDFRRVIIDTALELDNGPGFQQELREKCGALEQKKSIRAIKNAWLEKAEHVDPALYLTVCYRVNEAFRDRLKIIVENILKRKLIYEQAIFEDLVDNLSEIVSEDSGSDTIINDCLEMLEDKLNSNLLEDKYLSVEGFKLAILELFDQLQLSLTKKELSILVNLAFEEAEISYQKPDINLILEELLVSEPTEDSCNDICSLPLNGLYDICIELSDDIDPSDEVIVNRVKKAVLKRLHQFRNLGEDFLTIEEVKAQKMGFCAEIEISEDADKEEVLSEVIFQIQAFLTPQIPFRTFAELRARSMSCDDIYNGPLLDHGFILEEDLDKAPLRTVVNRSDVVQVIMDVPNVEAVRFLKIYRLENEKINKNDLDRWCISMPTKHKPVLDLDAVEVKFKIGSIFTIADVDKVQEKLSLKNQLNANNGFALTTVAPSTGLGRYRNLDTYYSIQNEFPMTYHIGREGLPSTASELRKAQAKQLKGFLLFFDQLLANYLAQLAEFRSLFSVHQKVDTPSYFFKVLTEEQIPGVSDLLPENGCAELLSEIVENVATRRTRKNIILDHLLARFGEKFVDFALWQYTTTTASSEVPRIVESFDGLLQAKAGFLRVLPQVGGERGKGYNYRLIDCGKPDVWDSTNVSGLKKRVSSLLGFSDFKRRTLTCPPEFDTAIVPVEENGAVQCYGFKLIDNRTKRTLLTGVKEYKLSRNARKAAKILYELALEEENFFFIYNQRAFRDPGQIDIGNNEEVIVLAIKNSNGNIVAQSSILNLPDAVALRDTIAGLAYPADCGNEGFHLIEHILLRPLQKNVFELLQPFRLSDRCIVNNPYSFWITIIIPSWQDRFQDRNARDLFEQVVRREAPAHLGIRFLALNNEEMKDFEVIYRRWLTEKAREKPNAREETKHTNDLVRFLNQYKNKVEEDPQSVRSRLRCEE